jgi:hypothetical protein
VAAGDRRNNAGRASRACPCTAIRNARGRIATALASFERRLPARVGLSQSGALVRSEP